MPLDPLIEGTFCIMLGMFICIAVYAALTGRIR